MKIKITKLAENDLKSIEAYINPDNPNAAVKTILYILNAIENLISFPALGRLGRVPNTRELIVSSTPFIVVYAVHRNEIIVYRVIHMARGWD